MQSSFSLSASVSSGLAGSSLRFRADPLIVAIIPLAVVVWLVLWELLLWVIDPMTASAAVVLHRTASYLPTLVGGVVTSVLGVQSQPLLESDINSDVESNLNPI